ncbi:MAG: hypothetical protein Q9164_002304 [Protoblastenia rupestris]
MEAVAAAASIAGIVTLVFHSIDGLIKFKELFADVSAASRTITRLLKDIDSLIQTLENVRDVLEQFEAQKKEKNFASLDLKVADCSRDVHVWIATARIIRPADEHGSKAWLKRFRLVVNSNAIETIREEIGRHRQALCLSLAVLGRTIDLHTSEQIHKLGGKYDESLSSHNVQEEALRRIEHYSRASLARSTHSIQSMDTIRSELSRIEAMISGSKTSPMAGTIDPYHRIQLEQRDEFSGPGTLATQESTSGNPPPKSSCEDGPNTGVATPDARVWHEQHLKPLANHHLVDEVDVTSKATSTLVKEDANGTRYLHTNMITSRETLQTHRNGLFNGYEIAQRDQSGDSVAHDTCFQDPLPNTEGVKIDYGAMHDLLLQSTAEIYPAEVSSYISTHRLVMQFETHLHLLRTFPSNQTATYTNGYYRSKNGLSTAYDMIRDQLIDLRHKLEISRQRCTRAGYSIAEINKALFPPSNQCHTERVLSPTDSDDDDWRDALEG